jgi:hypothetical protein
MIICHINHMKNIKIVLMEEDKTHLTLIKICLHLQVKIMMYHLEIHHYLH